MEHDEIGNELTITFDQVLNSEKEINDNSNRVDSKLLTRNKKILILQKACNIIKGELDNLDGLIINVMKYSFTISISIYRSPISSHILSISTTCDSNFYNIREIVVDYIGDFGNIGVNEYYHDIENIDEVIKLIMKPIEKYIDSLQMLRRQKKRCL